MGILIPVLLVDAAFGDCINSILETAAVSSGSITVMLT